MKYCAEVGKELGLEVKPGFLPKECCDSCHDDLNETGEPLIILDDAGAEVCCSIMRLYEDAHKKEKD